MLAATPNNFAVTYNATDNNTYYFDYQGNLLANSTVNCDKIKYNIA
jgi:hypothetical protein